MITRPTIIGAAFGVLSLAAAQPVLADCIRSCTAHLYVDLTYQPKGEGHTQRKTPTLKTLVQETADGRYGGGCIPSGIIKAKERACTTAVQMILRRYDRYPRAQKDAVCRAAQVDSTLFERAQAGFPEADWYAIDKMYAYGKRDIVRRKGDLSTDRSHFACADGRSVQPESARPPRSNSTSEPTGDRAAPPPPPSRASGESAPPPPSGSTGRAAPPPPAGASDQAAPPPPPTFVGDGKPDLIITRAELRPTGECRANRPVLTARVIIRNGGRAPAPEVTSYAMVNAIDEGIRWGNGKKLVGLIPPRTSREVIFPIYYLQSNPEGMNGMHTFAIKADPGNRVAESNEGNNTVKRNVNVSCR